MTCLAMYNNIVAYQVEETCFDCGKRCKVALMRQHLLECPGGPSENRSRSRSPLHEWSEPGLSQRRRRPRDAIVSVVLLIFLYCLAQPMWLQIQSNPLGVVSYQ